MVLLRFVLGSMRGFRLIVRARRLGCSGSWRTARRLAERKGWEVVERYVDDDVSAWSGKGRPEYTRCLDDLAAGVIDGLLVYDLDRLHRQPRELEAFIDLCHRLRLTNVTSVSGDIDLTRPGGPVPGPYPGCGGSEGKRR